MGGGRRRGGGGEDTSPEEAIIPGRAREAMQQVTAALWPFKRLGFIGCDNLLPKRRSSLSPLLLKNQRVCHCLQRHQLLGRAARRIRARCRHLTLRRALMSDKSCEHPGPVHRSLRPVAGLSGHSRRGTSLMDHGCGPIWNFNASLSHATQTLHI